MSLVLVAISPGGGKSEVNIVVFVGGKHNHKPQNFKITGRLKPAHAPCTRHASVNHALRA